MKHEPFVIERIYDAPVDRVWKAITDKEQMKEWYFDIAEFRPEVGFEFSFEGSNEDKRYLHLCKITDVVHERKLKYSWRYENYEGITFVTFDLFPEEKKTRLKLTHEGLETLPSIPDFARSNFEAGWTQITGSSLKDFVEKKDVKEN
jgi:uncharacterized protein YndB with AHSA1/START domain